MPCTNLIIAQTILAQLGGRRFIAMTGARNFICGENYLMFSLPKGFAKDGINKIRITLDWTDTYIFEALKDFPGPELPSHPGRYFHQYHRSGHPPLKNSNPNGETNSPITGSVSPKLNQGDRTWQKNFYLK